MTLKLITAPQLEPVTLAEAKAHLRCGDDEDALIGVLIQAAREAAEHQIGRAIVTQTWEAVFDAFPEREIELAKPAVSAVLSVSYIDAGGVSRVLAPELYSLDAEDAGDSAWVLPAINTTWPNTLNTVNAVRVRFTTGYGAPAAVPAAIKSWMLLRIGTLYKVREEVVAGLSVAEVPGSFVDRLLDPFRVWG